MASPITSGGPAPSPAQRSTGPYAILNVVRDGTAPSELFPGPGPSPNTVLLEPEDGPDVRVVTCHILRVMAPDGPGRPPRTAAQGRQDQRLGHRFRLPRRGGLYQLRQRQEDDGHHASRSCCVTARQCDQQGQGQEAACRQHDGRAGALRLAGDSRLQPQDRPPSQDKLRLGVATPGGGLSLLLDIVMPGFPTGEVARDVVQRAVRYEPTHFGQEMTPEQRQRVENLRHAVPLAPQPGGLATYFLREVPSALIPTYKGRGVVHSIADPKRADSHAAPPRCTLHVARALRWRLARYHPRNELGSGRQHIFDIEYRRISRRQRHRLLGEIRCVLLVCWQAPSLSPYGYGYRNCTDYVAWKIQDALQLMAG